MMIPQKQDGTNGPIKAGTGGRSLLPKVEAHCPKHGKYEATKCGHIVQGCPKCQAEERASEKGVVINLHNKAVAMNRYACGFPKRFACSSFGNFKVDNDGQQYALNTAKGYAENFRSDAHATGTCLSFMGTVGTGKTHLACAIGNKVLDEGLKVLYTTARQAVNAIKETWRRDSKTTESQILAKFLAPDLLVFDEVGVQFNTEAEKVLMFDIFDGRYGRMLPSVVVSNLSLEGLEIYMGNRSVDRLRENGGPLVEFKWESFRR
ncbi:MAG: ATP-binding protein [Pseudodesulfovibrio sp.]|nr:ATP-binding protein [Pseudodesulfovibrio sp.]